MADIAIIYAPWNGNAEEMANDIGQPGVLVRQWRNRGFIRPIYWSRIIDEAAKRGFVLTAADFPDNEDTSALTALVQQAAA